MTDTDVMVTEQVKCDREAGADLFALVRRSTAWLDDTNGRDEAEVRLRILKVMEEAGEVAQAVIGAAGQNPRKGQTHTVDDVACELVDVAVTALVALHSFRYVDVAAAVGATVERVGRRLDELGVAP
ncbi:MazG-like family protein [Micromonospora sp. NPDC048986]|uniref:MazG-like family protein n=1 Tax=Micromonospora sp. NPDC048986 TaxID=3155644 RepID=UPI0033C572E9